VASQLVELATPLRSRLHSQAVPAGGGGGWTRKTAATATTPSGSRCPPQFCFKSIHQAAADRADGQAAADPDSSAPTDHRVTEKHLEMSSLQLEASGTSESTGNSSSQTPNRKAPIWEYYEPELVKIDGALKVICKYCGTKLIANSKSGTNSLRTHIAEYRPKVPSDDSNGFVATMKKKPDGRPFTFNKQRSRDLMIAWIVRADVAFNKFDDEGFEPWMESMQPTFSGIGRQTIRNDCVAKFERAKIELRSELQSLSSRICFTSDLWTSNQKLGYLCVTAHYIGPDFVLKKKIIAFKDVKYPHTGVAIEEAITIVLTDYGIKEKMILP